MTMPHALFGQDLLSLDGMSSNDIADLLSAAATLKAMLRRSEPHVLLAGKSLAMLFLKHSTRTRASFEVGMFQLGGQAVFLSANDIQLSRGETLGDTARVLSRYVHAIMARVFDHSQLEELADGASVPVINGLSDLSHPVQALADALTIKEHFGGTSGVRLAYFGDGNNMTHALLDLAPRAGMHISVATPPGYEPDPQVVARARAAAEQAETEVLITHDPDEAAATADVLYTDVWVSMGQSDTAARMAAMRPYAITEKLMEAARPGAIFLHCLPMHRGEEVAMAVADGPRSFVFDQAENRLHVHKAILALLCSPEGESLTAR